MCETCGPGEVPMIFIWDHDDDCEDGGAPMNKTVLEASLLATDDSLSSDGRFVVE